MSHATFRATISPQVPAESTTRDPTPIAVPTDLGFGRIRALDGVCRAAELPAALTVRRSVVRSGGLRMGDRVDALAAGRLAPHAACWLRSVAW